VDVYTFNNQTDLPLTLPAVQAIVQAVVASEGLSFDEAAIHFVDEKAICSLHQQYFNDPSPTDCISFPMDDANDQGFKVLGEVFVCPSAAIQYAAKEGGDPYRETTLYIIHGLLHLMGYDDIKDEDRVRMRQAEQRHMQHLKEKQLVLVPPT